ncbi:MAG: protein TolQ [Microvirga sp.]
MNPSLDAALPAAHDLSLLGLFLQADPIVKAVMLFLLLVSVICWGIIFDKVVRLLRARDAVSRFEEAVRSDAAFADSSQLAGPSQAILGAGLREWLDPARDESRAERRERIERAMRESSAGELRRLEPGLSFLATVGSTAPFIGLFGTVWGIMNSFASIAQANDTSLAVVAPGIAEALFATAIGLFAAIPAVLAYNKLQSQVTKLQSRLEGFADEFSAILSRQIDERMHAHAAQAA